jgi:hypothetical protein
VFIGLLVNASEPSTHRRLAQWVIVRLYSKYSPLIQSVNFPLMTFMMPFIALQVSGAYVSAMLTPPAAWLPHLLGG